MKMKLKYHFLWFVLAFCSNVMACPSVSLSATNVTCYAGFDGVATISVTGSNGPFDILWSQNGINGSLPPLNSGNTTSVSGLPAGVFSVYVTDQLGCTSIQVITIYQPDAITATTTITDVSCYGQPTGVVDLSPVGGTPPYSYNWSNGNTTEDLINVFSGNYTVTISDNNGCSSSSIPSVINQPAEAVQTTYAYQNVSCAFGSDGYIDLSTWGGTAPYTFSWNSGTFLTEDIANLPANTYTVLVTDSKGCQESNSIVLTEPTMLTSTISGTDVLCNGTATGTVNLTPAGGTLPYSFSWANSTLTLGNSEDLSNIPAENYQVTIIDGNGCTALNSIVINEPLLLTTSIVSNNVSCFGGTDGNINLTVNGGTPLYTYNWTNSSSSVGTTQNLTNIPSETYNVEVTDGNGCLATNSVIITQPLAPISLTYTKVDVLCNGDNTGSIDLTVVGGTPGYNYSWSNTANQQDVINLFAGNYNVTVQDLNGCIENQIVEITQPLAPLSVSSIINDVLCFGDSTGSVNLTTAGGTLPYSYSWLNSQFALSTITEDLINYPADTYILTLLDGNNCLLNDTLTINEPPILNGILVPTNVLCFGESSGIMDLTTSGGTAPYNYSWSNGQITEDLINVLANTYTVTITDDHNCIFVDSAIISQPIAALSSFYSTDEPLCPGGNDGNIYYGVEGGTLPYSYAWTNGEVTPAIFDLTAGMYQITVTDGNGCQLFDAATLNEPDIIVLNEIGSNLNCFESNDGKIDLSVTGGTAPYNYDWTNSTYELSLNDEDLTSISADTYTVTITDDNNCSYTQSIEVTQPTLLEVEVIEQNISCDGAQDGGIELVVTGGTPNYNYAWDNGETASEIIDLAAGIYVYSVTDNNNCLQSDSVELKEPAPIYFNEIITPVSCRDQKDGIIEVYPTGGYGQYEYLWSTNSADYEITELLGGFYTVTVTDLVGCVKDTTFEMPVLDVECLEVPNAFTPNGDGINDDWQIHNIYLYPEASVQVFNKWGKIVFEITNGYNVFWDGTKNGRELPADTYFYIIKIREDIHPYTGPITIVR